MNLQAEQAPLDREIWERLFELVPEDATGVRLVLERSAGEEGGVVRHTLEGMLPDGATVPIDPSDALFAATRALELLLVRHGAAFLTATYEGREQPDGRWKTKQFYAYPTDASADGQQRHS